MCKDKRDVKIHTYNSLYDMPIWYNGIMVMTLDKLAIIMKNGFDAVDERFDAVDERFKTVDQRFKTVDQRFDSMQAYMDQRFDSIEARLREFGEDIKQVRNDVENMKGFSKDIDNALDRIVVLEKGYAQLQKQIAKK